jgi:peptide chain release factor 3
MNKLDRPSRAPLELLDELERVLGIHALPINWPLGSGREFRGVYDRQTREVHLFEKTPGGAYRAPVAVADVNDDAVRKAMDPDTYHRVQEELGLLDGAGTTFVLDEVRAGKVTPVFFGSAMNNFGVEMLLQRFLELAPPPAPRRCGEEFIAPDQPGFSGFVFKIQANMDPKHRDHVAFLRIVSGVFRRDMSVIHPRTGKRLRLSNSKRLFARERETVDEAYAGDVVGLVGNYDLHIGDSLAENPGISFDEMPRFAPETFVYLHNDSSANFKRFREGLAQLLKEGVAQAYELPDSLSRVPLLGAVGALQFDVLQYRLETEYGAPTRRETASWNIARWVRKKQASGDAQKSGDSTPPSVQLPTGATLARDTRGSWVVLLPNEWTAGYLEKINESFEFLPFPASAADHTGE